MAKKEKNKKPGCRITDPEVCKRNKDNGITRCRECSGAPVKPRIRAMTKPGRKSLSV